MAKGNSDGFDVGSVLLRMVFSLALVFLTFNPTGHSYFHWLFFIRATFTSMGTVGVVLLLALFGAIIWWMVSAGLLSTADRSTMAWVVLTCLGLLLGFGMSWAHIRARISGQASVDRVDQ